jgi:hypothetical protein
MTTRSNIIKRHLTSLQTAAHTCYFLRLVMSQVRGKKAEGFDPRPWLNCSELAPLSTVPWSLVGGFVRAV